MVGFVVVLNWSLFYLMFVVVFWHVGGAVILIGPWSS